MPGKFLLLLVDLVTLLCYTCFAYERVKRAFGVGEVERAVEDAKRQEVAERPLKGPGVPLTGAPSTVLGCLVMEGEVSKGVHKNPIWSCGHRSIRFIYERQVKDAACIKESMEVF